MTFFCQAAELCLFSGKSRSYYLLIIVRLKGGTFRSCRRSPMFWMFYNLHGCALPRIWLDSATRFITLLMVSGFLWHSTKWAHRLGRFLQYTLGLEVLACSFDTDFNYVTTILQLRLSLNHEAKFWQHFGVR